MAVLQESGAERLPTTPEPMTPTFISGLLLSVR